MWIVQGSEGSKRLVILLIAAACAATDARAQTGSERLLLDFENGALPTADPRVRLLNEGGQSEATLFNVAGGRLNQTTFGQSGTSVYYAGNSGVLGWPTTSFPVAHANGIVFEARVAISSSVGVFGVQMEVVDSAGDYYGMAPHAGGLWVVAGQSISAASLPSGWSPSGLHAYRMECAASASTFDVFVDGVLVLDDAQADSYPVAQCVLFGDDGFAPTNGANATWECVHFAQGPDVLSQRYVVTATGAGFGAAGAIPSLGVFQPPVPGFSGGLRISGASALASGLLFVSLAPAGPTSLPGGGIAHLDLASTVPLLPVAVDAFGGWSGLVAIPADPTWTGLTFALQAALVDGAAPGGIAYSSGLLTTLGV